VSNRVSELNMNTTGFQVGDDLALSDQYRETLYRIVGLTSAGVLVVKASWLYRVRKKIRHAYWRARRAVQR
jgi:hypothetical protein